jgi:ribosome biogenesis GTPase
VVADARMRAARRIAAGMAAPAGFRRDRAAAHERAAVGDWVLLEGRRIVALLPRRSSIKRAAAGEHYHQQVIAANIDTVFVASGWTRISIRAGSSATCCWWAVAGPRRWWC